MIPTHNTIDYRCTPYISYFIIAACGLVFLYQLSLSAAHLQEFFTKYALVPARYTDPDWAIKTKLWWLDPLPFLTSMFLHGGLLHILGNMWTLWIFGPSLEDRLGVLGFLALYLVSGLAAGLMHFLFNIGSDVPTLGASGAIAGVIGAYARRFPYAWINVVQPIGIFPVFLYMPALMFAGIWFLLQFVQAGGSLATGANTGVAWWAHVGGFIVGWALLPRLAPTPDPVEENKAALKSLFWPWAYWARWVTWWWRR